MQLRCRACPDIADNPPLPQPCKEVLHPCTIEAMDIIILLLVATQSFPTNIRHIGVQGALIGAVMRTDFKIEKLSMCSRRTTLIPNHDIGGATPKRGLRVPNPNSRGHATKRGLDNWPGFLNSTGRFKAQNNARSKMPGAHPVR